MNPRQMLDFVNMNGGGRSGHDKTLLKTPLTQANCLVFSRLQADQDGDMSAIVARKAIEGNTAR